MDKLQAFIEDELSRAPALLARVLDATLEELRDDLLAPGRRADESKGRLIEAVVADRPAFEKRFVEALRGKVAPGASPVEGRRNTLDFASSELMLIDDDQVQEGIVVARAFELVEQRAEWELRDLQSLTSALVGGKVSKDTNPFTPQNYAHALGQAVKVLRVSAADQHALINASVSALSRELKLAYAAAAKRLREAGVVPASYQATQVVTPQASPAAADPVTQVPSAQATGADAPAPAFAALPGTFVQASASAQTMAVPKTLHADAAAHMSDLFAAMQRDRAVPLAARSALSDMARCATGLAQRDAGVLADAKHALWQLVNRFGEASSLYPGISTDSADPPDPRLAELLDYWRMQVLPALEADGADSLTCIKLLSGLELVLGRLRQSQLEQAREAMEKIERVERQALGMGRARRLIDARLTGLVVPSAVRSFLKGPWSAVMARLIDARGMQSTATRQAQATVDELLETLTPLSDTTARAARVRQVGAVRAQVKAGLNVAELLTAENEAFLDRLSQMQALVLAARPGATELSDAVVRPMSADELRADALSDEPTGSATGTLLANTTMPVIDANALATVPANLMQTAQPGGPRRFAHMAVGDVCRIFVGGGFQPVQLLWISPQQRYWLFSGPEVGVVTSLAKQALEQLDAAGLMKPLHHMSLLDRCLARVSGVVDTHF